MTDETGNADVLDAIGDAPGTDDTPADHVRDRNVRFWLLADVQPYGD